MRILFIFFTLLTACDPRVRDTASGCAYIKNQLGETISFNRTAPRTLYVHESVETRFYPDIQKAIDELEAAAGRDLFFVAVWGQQGPLLPRKDGSSTIYQGGELSLGENGRARNYWFGDLIQETDITILEGSRLFGLNEPIDIGKTSFYSIILHELGHAMGLDHVDDPGSAMFKFTYYGERRGLGGDDAKNINCKY